MQVVCRKSHLAIPNVTFEDCDQLIRNKINGFKQFEHETKNQIIEYITQDLSVSRTKFEKQLVSLVLKRKTKSSITTGYWLNRGYSEKEAKLKISEQQRKRSPRCKEYWLAKGYTEEEATKKVTEKQTISSKESAKKRTVEYWVQQGFTFEEAKQRKQEFTEHNTPSYVAFWINRGYTEEDAKERIKSTAQKGSTLDYFIDLLGEEEGLKRYNEVGKKKSRCGELNGQYGKPAPKGSGRGISGFYKDYYFRSLFEYEMIKEFERNGIEFECNDVAASSNPNKVTIKYVDADGQQRTYIPDFIAGDLIIEVKANYGFQTENWKRKEEATQKFLRENRHYSKLVKRSSFQVNKNETIQDYINGDLKIDHKKINRFKQRVGLK